MIPHFCRRLAALLTACASLASAQTAVWTTHTDKSEIRDIAVSGQDVWAATGGGVFVLKNAGTSGQTFASYTNIDGLASIDMRAIAVDGSGRVLAGSSDGYLNIFEAGAWSTVPDIARALEKTQRGINVLRVRGEDVFIGTDFGISVYSPARRSFKDTYLKFGNLPSQARVLDVHFLRDSLWVATDQGVAVASLGGGNLQDPSAWKSYSSTDGLLSSNVLSITSFQGSILAGTSRGVSILSGNQWVDGYPDTKDTPVLRLLNVSDTLFVVLSSRILRAQNLAGTAQMDDDLNDPYYTSKPRFTSIVSRGMLEPLIGSNRGLAIRDGRWKFVKPNAPGANVFLSMSVDGAGTLWACSGGIKRGVYAFDGQTWSTFTTAEYPGIVSDDVHASTPGTQNDMYFGTWGSGIVHRKEDGSFEHFDPTTVPCIPGAGKDPLYAVVIGLAFDAKGTLWALHRESNTGVVLSSRTADGTWRCYQNAYPESQYSLGLVIDPLGNKWYYSGEHFRGCVGFNENGTLDNTADDLWFKVDPTDYFASGGSVKALAIDRMGDIWIGTNLGVRTVYNPRTPDKSSRTCYNTRCNIEGQDITVIAVDPVNNKWIGTDRSGVFVLSADGSTLLAQYTTDNSPLVDNHITSIVVHPSNGIAYLGTGKGLSALSTPFVQAATTSGELRISPNPFRPGVDEQVLVDGLVEGSTLKILSASGHLVAEIATPGGRVGFWDGRQSDGSFVSSGIYFIVAGAPDGTQATVGKLAVIRK
jgi:ligand-binding sensor domain-containing protein